MAHHLPSSRFSRARRTLVWDCASKHCKILLEVITTAKNRYYNNYLLHSQNKQKSIWNIIQNLTNNITAIPTIQLWWKWRIIRHISDNHLTIANDFNKNFLSVVDNIIDENITNSENLTSENIDPLKYLHNVKVFFIHQLMHKWIVLKTTLKLTLKQLRHVSVQSPSSGSAIFDLPKVTIILMSILM
jgi:hypothetical protein